MNLGYLALAFGEWGGLESGTSPRGAFLRLKALIGDDQEFHLDISSFKG